MLSLDIHLLRSFVAVSRSRSIKVAAEMVGRTQSAVSMQMQRLEDIAGQPVLHRTRYGVELTATGERLLSHAKRILDEHDEALADIRGKGLHGLICVGCPEEYLSAFFPDLLRQFSEAHTGIDIEVICAPSTELRRLLKQSRVDLAIVSVPESGTDTEDLIYHENFVWVADSPSPMITRQEVIPLALPASDTLEHRFACSAIESIHQPYRVAFASDRFAGLIAITRSGQAISVMTQSAVPDDLYVLENMFPVLPQIRINLVYAASKPSLIAQTFGEFIKMYFAEH